MRADDVQEILDRHVFVARAHAGRRRSVHISRNIVVPSHPRVRASEATYGLGLGRAALSRSPGGVRPSRVPDRTSLAGYS